MSSLIQLAGLRDWSQSTRSMSMADRQYELVYILPPDTTEQQAGELHEQVESTVTRMGGRIDKTDNWGRRRLAYEIGRLKEGVYVLEVIIGTGELMKELDRRLKVIDQVVRHLIVRVDEEKKVVERTRTKRQSESERRRVKRGLPPQRQPGEGRSSEADELDDDRDDRFDGMEG
ncbi:MAG: 30S ribosomal protein S6 [Acidobacteria bacterium]|nr:MAG: 30S ribosomal protein S6 [Acidobacteriota bacterium]